MTVQLVVLVIALELVFVEHVQMRVEVGDKHTVLEVLAKFLTCELRRLELASYLVACLLAQVIPELLLALELVVDLG